MSATQLDGRARVEASDLDSLTREEAEVIAARVLKEVAKREPLRSAMQLVHLAVKLEGFAAAVRVSVPAKEDT